jgi:hypothetical protein
VFPYRRIVYGCTAVQPQGGSRDEHDHRHGTGRVAKAVLIAAVPPLMLQTPANPEGLPMGEDDQIVPVHDSARKSARLIKGAEELYYPGAPHGLTATLQDRVNADLLAFLQS